MSEASADTFLYLETRGRKTGLARRIEIWFVELAGKFYIVAEMRERTGWVRNIRAHAAVEFSVGQRNAQASLVPLTPAHARIVDVNDEPELAARIRAAMDAKYEWSDGLLVELAPVVAAN